MSMFIILPHDVDGISKLEEKLTSEELSKMLVRLPKREVRVSLPKFKLEETTDLKDILKGVCIRGYKGPMFVTSSRGYVYVVTRDRCL
jgi:serine protease inhibitor